MSTLASERPTRLISSRSATMSGLRPIRSWPLEAPSTGKSQFSPSGLGKVLDDLPMLGGEPHEHRRNAVAVLAGRHDALDFDGDGERHPHDVQPKPPLSSHLRRLAALQHYARHADIEHLHRYRHGQGREFATS